MSTLIKMQIQSIKSKIGKLEKKYIFLIAVMFILSLLLLDNILHVLLMPHMELMQDILTKYVFIFIIYICIMLLPIEVYKTFVENKEFDILFMAPLSLRVCFGWNYMKKIVPAIMIGGVILVLFVPFMIMQEICISNYFVLSILLLLTIYTGYILVEMLLYIFLGNNLYKGIITIVGLEEVISFFIVMNIFEGEANWLDNVDFSKLLYNKSIWSFVLWMGLLGCQVIISYFIFEIAYYKRGCCNKTSDKAIFNINVMEKVGSFYYLSKDLKVLIRNIDRMKYLIVTCMIYFFSTFINAQKVNSTAVFIAILSFSVIVVFQISYENIMDEKKTYDVLLMSGISLSEFVLHKMKFATCNTSVVVILYGVCLVVKNGLSFLEVLNIGLVIIPIILFSAFFINFGYSVIFLTFRSGKPILESLKLIIKTGMKMMGYIVIILAVYVCLYFVKISINWRCICVIVSCFFWTFGCEKIYNRNLKQNLSI